MLTHLALVIDLTEDRLEKTSVPFLRTQINAQLEKLFQRFESEYQAFLAATGQAPSVAVLRVL